MISPPLNRVVIIGAGGRTGMVLINEALRAGYQVKALVRTPPSSGLPERAGLAVLAGDARDADDLRAVLEPGDAVVSAVGASGRNSHGLYADVARAVVTAAGEVSVRRLVVITSSGVNSADPNHPWWYRRLLIPFIKPTYDDMAEMETIIERSGLDWTIVRPSRLIDEPTADEVRVGDATNPVGGLVISRAALSRFIIAELANGAWLRRHPTLAR